MDNYEQLDAWDWVYISYDEPRAEDNWARIKNINPMAQRVHGVKGFDRAHKRAAEITDTQKILTIDGDNWIREDLNEMVYTPPPHQDDVCSWTTRNPINGLCYGNGGVKLWPRHVLESMKTHEASNDSLSKVDFCWTLRYYQYPEIFSENVINGSPEQAFRAGYREGTKLALNEGEIPPLNLVSHLVPENNLRRLAIWCTLGLEEPEGYWAVLGCRLGLYDTHLKRQPIERINDYEWFSEYFEELSNLDSTKDLYVKAGDFLRECLKMPVIDWPLVEDEEQIRFYYQNPERKGYMNGRHAETQLS